MKDEPRSHPFRDSTQDIEAAKQTPDTPQTRAPAYRLAFTDTDFMMREELRPVRLQLELLKPQLVLDERGIRSTVVVMGSARVRPDGAGPAGALAPWYDEARKLAHLITVESLKSYGREWVVVTGGGPGIMEAGNRGASEAGGQSIGLNIVLPHEQAPNQYVTPDLSFNFHYFAIRKMHFLMRAVALVSFPGGLGTLDELFEVLTLTQTRKIRRRPIVLIGRDFWERLIDFDVLVEHGVISPEDKNLFHYAETAEEAWDVIKDAYSGDNPALTARQFKAN